MGTFLTPNRHGYNVRFSPHNSSHLAVATSQFFGLRGCGTLFLVSLQPSGRFIPLGSLNWSDGLYDCAWSENDPSLVVTSSGDGSLQVWNLSNLSVPPLVHHEHNKEVYSVDCLRRQILSGSWDGTAKVWEIERKASLVTLQGHEDLIYEAKWAPHMPHCFASVSGDKTLRIWDALRLQTVLVCKAHDAEILTCDWSKHDRNVLVTGGVDGLIKTWDVRNFSRPICTFISCEYAIRRVRFSPHIPGMLASVSYDQTTRIWSFYNEQPLETFRHHSEFVYGLDWNPTKIGEVADCAWDSLVRVFTPQCMRAFINKL